MTTQPAAAPADVDAVGDAADLLATAAALGMDVPAPVGTTAYAAQVQYSKRRRTLVGLYPTRDAALNALADLLIRSWCARPGTYNLRPWLADVFQGRRPFQDAAYEQNLIREWIAAQPDLPTLLDALTGDEQGSGSVSVKPTG